jgi:hypothetical protein
MCCVRNESWMRTSRVYQQSNPGSYAGAICISDPISHPATDFKPYTCAFRAAYFGSNCFSFDSSITVTYNSAIPCTYCIAYACTYAGAYASAYTRTDASAHASTSVHSWQPSVRQATRQLRQPRQLQ